MSVLRRIWFKLTTVITVVGLLLSGFTPSQVLAAAESWKLISQIGGSTQAVFMVADTVYAGIGLRLSVIDISAPTSPVQIGSTAPFGDFVQDVFVDGNYAYVAAGDAGLGIVDIHNPHDPLITAVLDTRGYAEGLAVADNIVYMADGSYGLRVINASDPSNPVEMASAFPFYDVLEVTLAGNMAYLAAGGAGVLVVNIQDPSHPVEVTRVETDGFAYGVSVSGSYAYIADAWHGVQIVDITNPSAPLLKGSFQTTGWALSVASNGTLLYTGIGADGLQILNVADPNAPTMVKKISAENSFVRKVAFAGSQVVLADTLQGVRVINVADPVNANQVGVFCELPEARYVAVANGFAFVAAGSAGALYSVDVSDPLHPFQVGKFQGAGYAPSVGINGNFAFLGTFMDSPNYLWVLNASNPASLTQAAVVPLTSLDPAWGAPRELAIQGTYLYVADEYGLRIYDISSPADISFTGKIDLHSSGDETVGVAVSGSYAYVAGGSTGIRVVNINDPTNPTLSSTFTTDGFNQATGVSGNRLYAGNSGSGIQILDISNLPNIPPALGSYDTPGTVDAVAASGNTLFVSDGGAGVQVLDVTDPAHINLIQSLPNPGFAYQSFPLNDLLYVASGSSGLLIYQKQTTQPSMDLLQNSPRPPTQSPNGLIASEGSAAIPPNMTAQTGSTLGQNRPPTATATCTVTSKNDSGAGTLRACLTNALSGSVILFSAAAFPPESPGVITLSTPLPDLTKGSVTIDGSNAGVILEGNHSVATGLKISSSHNIIMGLQFRNFAQDAIVLEFPGNSDLLGENQIGGDHTIGSGPSGQGNVITGCENGVRLLYSRRNTILGNFIGTNAAGTALGETNSMGIAVSSHATENRIGGTTTGTWNIIGGNDRGIDIADSTAAWNVIAGNYVGTDITGSYAIPNESGIVIEVGARNNTVGGRTPADRNLVSGNTGFGIVISDPKTVQNSIIGNYVGLTAAGTAWPANQNNGISVWSSSFNRVGGSLPGEGNLVSGNSFPGVSIGGLGYHDVIVMGNQIGGDANGGMNVGNNIGIMVYEKHNFIGGLGIGDGNLITGNGWGLAITSAGVSSNWVAGNNLIKNSSIGIYISDYAANNYISQNKITGSDTGIRIDAGTGNTLRANSISANSGEGIFLVDGGNGLLSPPQLVNLDEAAVSGTTCANCIVEVFSDPGSQGRYYEGWTQANGSGQFIFSKRLLGPNVTATTTDPSGNTSGFSNYIPISWEWFNVYVPIIRR